MYNIMVWGGGGGGGEGEGDEGIGATESEVWKCDCQWDINSA